MTDVMDDDGYPEWAFRDPYEDCDDLFCCGQFYDDGACCGQPYHKDDYRKEDIYMGNEFLMCCGKKNEDGTCCFMPIKRQT